MEHFYTGSKADKLYSVYHEPRKTGNNAKAVILCYPVGQEYIRCHRMYANLASKLADEGVHVVKFDYTGTGDSYGDFSGATAEAWIEDIAAIAEELMSGTEATQLYIVGVRLGAWLASRYAEKVPVEGLVLLSPVFDGKAYLDEIRQDYTNWLNGSFARQRRVEKDQLECHGFRYSAALCKAINGIHFSSVKLPDVPILIIDEVPLAIEGHPQVSFSESVNKKLWKKNKGDDNKDILPIHEINLISNWISRI